MTIGGTPECSSGGPDAARSTRAAATTDLRRGDQARRRLDQLAEIYPRLDKISVDYAVMEPVSQGKASARVVAVRLPYLA